MNILIAGDYCDKYRVKQKIAEGDYSSLFDNIKPIVDKADISIVNFEFPVVVTKGKPIKKAGPALAGQPKAVEAIKYAGFNVCTLANNHILDQGADCCNETKRLLNEAGIQTVGAGTNLQEAGQILYVQHNQETLAIINCCENEFSIATDESAGANPLNTIKQYRSIQEAKRNADYVLVIVHGGHEHCQLPSPRMKETYHFFIEVGADAVINHHQHCYSGYEEYNGKPIFYGLGNFLFDWEGKTNSIWNEGYMVSLTLKKDSKTEYTLFPYTQCNDMPVVVPLDGQERGKFENRVRDLNAIIADDKLLKQSWENWIANSSVYLLLDYQPYRGRILKGLFTRGMLPSFITAKKKYSILNHISCESHLDRLRYLIKYIK